MTGAPEPTDAPAATGSVRLAPRQALARLLEPPSWALYGCLPPAAALRALTTLLEELEEAALDEDERAGRDHLLAENLALLGCGRTERQRAALTRRHLRLQARRRAEELLLVQGQVEPLIAWGRELARVEGLEWAEQVAAAGRGAVVVSAHLGPMVLYAPMLAHHLTRGGRQPGPELLSVMNGPSSPLLEAQRGQFARHYPAPMRFVLKQPGGEHALLRELLGGLQRRAWVLLQVDVLSGGQTLRPLAWTHRRLYLPGIWGAARLAARSRLPLLPVLAFRGAGGRPALRIEPPVAPWTAAGTGRQDDPAVGEAAQALAAVLERWVYRDPADWVMLPRLGLFDAGPLTGLP